MGVGLRPPAASCLRPRGIYIFLLAAFIACGLRPYICLRPCADPRIAAAGAPLEVGLAKARVTPRPLLLPLLLFIVAVIDIIFAEVLACFAVFKNP